MKTLALIAVALSISTTAALAADLSYAPPPAGNPVYSWTGFYLGGHLGYGGARATSGIEWGTGGAFDQAIGNTSHYSTGIESNLAGAIAGLQAGFNWQSGKLIVGIEAEGSWTAMGKTLNCAPVIECQTNVNWTADLAGRMGYAVTDRAIAYIKGGIAWSNTHFALLYHYASMGSSGKIPTSGAVSGSFTTTQPGGVLGLGVEYAVLDHWTAKIEYDYSPSAPIP